MKKLYFLLFIFSQLTLFSQSKGDYQWLFGGNSFIDSLNGTQLNFLNTPVEVLPIQRNYSFDITNTSISNDDGNLLFYSDGCRIFDHNHEIMTNGDSIVSGYLYYEYCGDTFGAPLSQGAIILPQPDHPDRYYYFNLNLEDAYPWGSGFLGVAPTQLQYSIIQYDENTGNGAVLEKHIPAVEDTLIRCCITAVRHGNGRDWWIVAPESHTPCYYLKLLTPEGITQTKYECSGSGWSDGDLQNQVVFSPDGSKYARTASQDGLVVYDFDRCNGSFSNPVKITFPNDTFYYAGVAISPNSRFLYAMNRNKVYQFDLQATDIPSSKVLIAVRDSFADPFPSRFYLSMLAPDNKIYIAGSGNFNYLHIINYPDSAGTACGLIQHELPLPSISLGEMPNFPFFRLYDLPGSLCDTLGIDGPPPLATAPVVYRSFKAFPNPFTATLHLLLPPAVASKSCRICISDTAGKALITQYTKGKEEVIISTERLPDGMYFVTVEADGYRGVEKVVRYKE